MFESYFRLSAPPFGLTPDHRFFFESSVHKPALANLSYGLHQGEGFIVVTGEVGCGKTTLINHLLSQIDQTKFVVAHIVSTNLSHDELVGMIAVAFGIDDEGLSKPSLLRALELFSSEAARLGRRCIIFVDEAQNLGLRALEELRMLSNMMVGGRPAYQAFLLGQPQLKRTLARPELDQFRQRIMASYHLRALDAEETEEYIRHRLACVGWTGDPDVTPEAFGTVHARTGGVPRLVNTLMSRVLLTLYLEKRHVLDAETVNTVAAEYVSEMAATGTRDVLVSGADQLRAPRTAPQTAAPQTAALKSAAPLDETPWPVADAPEPDAPLSSPQPPSQSPAQPPSEPQGQGEGLTQGMRQALNVVLDYLSRKR